ncbi:MAG: hypothetical protein RR842_14115 [Gordonibacter sp.]|uniref:hypothetical protein n=1 Tax=Gordonibacter sp. TaxID=1968902 RepID=UPI002FCC986D
MESTAESPIHIITADALTALFEEAAPYYAPIKEAARIGGVSEAMMRAAVNNRIDPIPHIEVGESRRKKKLVRVASIRPWLDRQALGTIR